MLTASPRAGIFVSRLAAGTLAAPTCALSSSATNVPAGWKKVLEAASGSHESLQHTVNVLHTACQDESQQPPVKVYNELVRLSSMHKDTELVFKLVEVQQKTNLDGDQDTFIQLNSFFKYFPR